jgi:hypothetical protein
MQHPAEAHLPARAGESVSQRDLDIRARPADPQFHLPGTYRADPEVKAALAASGVENLAVPTLAAGETWRDVQGFTPDIGTLAARGLAYEHLAQLAPEHLYGIR